ncbi:MAG TPA: DUF4105 domain-containing protein [Gemmatimonadaceae bacterium]
MTTRSIILAVAGAFGVGAGIAWSGVEARADRDWTEVHARAPRIERDGDRITIRDIRAFTWPAAGGEPLLRWEDRTYRVDDVATVWYVVAPFETDWRGPAHTFLSFGFDDGRFLAVSVEARRERGEEYSMLGGLLKRFELIYVIGDERDLVASRVLRQDDATLLYPVRASRDGARALFRSVLGRVEELEQRPEWYGTLRSNCTTAILRHVDDVIERPIRWGLRVLLPGYSDALALERGLLDTDLSLEQARHRFRINERVRRFADAPDFSARIREAPDPQADALGVVRTEPGTATPAPAPDAP